MGTAATAQAAPAEESSEDETTEDAALEDTEAEVPLAMAEAFRQGNLGIMDYYKMKNIMADTRMRDTIGAPDGESSPEEQ